MHKAARDGNLAELELVAEYAPDRINETDRDGWTPLQTSKYGETTLSFTSNARVRQLLIDAGGH